MRKIFIPIALLSLAVILFAAAPDQSLPSLREFVVKVNPTNWLAASEIRFVPGPTGINPTNWAPVVSGNIEAWGEDVDNGVTNRSLIRRQAIVLTPNQLNTWNSQTGTNAFTWLQNALLAKTKLTLRQ